MAPKPQAREREVEEDRDDLVLDDKETRNQETMLADPDDDGDGEDNTKARRQQDPPRREASDDDELDDDQDARLAYDDDSDDGPRERGGSRRSRRNRARREAAHQSQAAITAMAQRIQQLEGALGEVSRGQVSLAAGDLDGQINSIQSQLDTIDAAMAKAVKEADDVTYQRGMRLRDEARDRLQSLGYEKQRLAASIDLRRQQQPQQRQAPAAQSPDPAAVRFSEKFMSRHEWFDPADPTDEDSMIVKAIDDALANEGYRANTKLYWLELERRVKARGLGDSGNDGDDMDDEQDDRRERAAPRRNTGGLPPRSGRNTGRRGGGNTVTLPTFAKETLDEMGLLETKGLNKDQLAQRSKLITQWDKGLKEAASARR